MTLLDWVGFVAEGVALTFMLALTVSVVASLIAESKR